MMRTVKQGMLDFVPFKYLEDGIKILAENGNAMIICFNYGANQDWGLWFNW